MTLVKKSRNSQLTTPSDNATEASNPVKARSTPHTLTNTLPTLSNRPITRCLDFTQIRWSEEFEPDNRRSKTQQFPSVEQITKLMDCDQEELKRLELVGLSFVFCGFARLNFLLSNGMESNLKIDNPTELYALPTDFNKNSIQANKK